VVCRASPDRCGFVVVIRWRYLRDSKTPPCTGMIVGFILSLLYTMLAFFVGLLPTIAVPTGWTDALSLIWGYLNSFAFLFPVSTLVSVLGVAVAFHLALLGYDLALKVYHMIRG